MGVAYSQALQAYNLAIGTPDETQRYDELNIALENYQNKQAEYAELYQEYTDIQALDQECLDAMDIGGRYQSWLRSVCTPVLAPNPTIPFPPPSTLTPEEYEFITSSVEGLPLRSLVGDIKFASADNGDVFFEKQVQTYHTRLEDNRLMGMPIFDFRFRSWVYSPNYSFYPLNEKPSATILNGFFEDKWKETESPEDNYKVNVYISYIEEV